MKKLIKNSLIILFIFAAVYFCIKYPSDIGNTVRIAMDRCAGIIIPSMFIFMCLTTAAVNSGLHNFIGIPLNLIFKYIFRLKSSQLGIFILSMFSGYPAGIKLLTLSYEKNEITKDEFDRLSCFCFASGPAFIFGTVSGMLFPDSPAGTVCLLSITIGNIATAFLIGLFSPFPPKNKNKVNINFNSQNIIDSILSSAHAIFQMCIMIVAFSGIYKAAELSGIVSLISKLFSMITGFNSDFSNAVISSVFEISNIVNLSGSTGILPIIAFLLSFGGICVLIQIIVISNQLLNVKKFMISRIFSASVSAIVCRLIMPFFDFGTVDVFVHKTVKNNNDFLPAVFLLIMTVMLLSLSKNYGQSEKKML